MQLVVQARAFLLNELHAWKPESCTSKVGDALQFGMPTYAAFPW